MQDIRYFLKSAFRNLWESKVTSIFTLVTLSVALGFLGAYLAVFLNLKAALGAVNEKVPLTVYLSDGISAAMTDAIKARLSREPVVAGFDYTSKEQALKEFKSTSDNVGALLDSIGGNPLPASFDVRLKAESAQDGAARLAADLKKMPGVEEVQFLQEEAGQLKAMFNSFSYAGLILGLGVLLGVVFISYSTLRLAVIRHSDEIEVMKLMGSRRSFIMAPFLFEGAVQGVAAAGLSLGLLYGILRLLTRGPSILLLPAGSVSFLPPWAWFGIILAGGLLGLTGSLFAFFRTLRM